MKFTKWSVILLFIILNITFLATSVNSDISLNEPEDIFLPPEWGDIEGITFNGSYSHNADMVIDSLGDPHLTWQDSRNGNQDIYYMKLNKDSDDEKLINDMRLTDGASNSCNPEISMGSDDMPCIVWDDDVNGNSEIYLMKLIYSDTNISKNISTIQVSIDDASDSCSPSMAMDRVRSDILDQ